MSDYAALFGHWIPEGANRTCACKRWYRATESGRFAHRAVNGHWPDDDGPWTWPDEDNDTDEDEEPTR